MLHREGRKSRFDVLARLISIHAARLTTAVETDSCGETIAEVPSASLDEVELLPLPIASEMTLTPVGRGADKS